MNSRLKGYGFTIGAVTILSIQDAIGKHLALSYSPVLITMIRYWGYGLFVVLMALRSRRGFSANFQSNRPLLQITRSAILAFQVVMAITCFSVIGLARSQAIFAATPILVALLSILFLKEQVDWRRWTAIGAGLTGVLLILKPEGGFFDLKLSLAVFASATFAVYIILTRLVSRHDSPQTSFFYTGFVGAIAISLIGPFFWMPVQGWDWVWIAVISCTSITSHYFLIRAYDLLDASSVQPLTYLGIVYASLIGTTMFGEQIRWNMVVGAAIVIVAGLAFIVQDHHRHHAAVASAPDRSS